MSYEAGYAAGRDAAYVEIYTALDDLDHARRCEGCRACEAMKATLEWMMRGLGRRLTQDEFYTLARILKSAEEKAIQEWQSKSPEQISQCGAEL